jgi:hypothetical protein
MDTQGVAGSSGNVSLVLNPPEIDDGIAGVEFTGARVRAELDDGKLSVKVIGQVSYLGRTLTHTLDVTDDVFPVSNLLQQILDAYLPVVKQATLADAYQAHAVAGVKGEIK